MKMLGMLFALAAGLASVTRAGDLPHLYVTWAGTEPDKGASAWYIKRHINPRAVFEVQPHGSMVERGTAFDTPFARYRRIHNASTMETLLREHPSSDPVVKKLALLTHDIEINLWQPKQYPESRVVEARVKELDATFGGHVPMECFVAFFDNVYQWLEAQRADAESLKTPQSCRPG
jgi:hypothetical protein